jgi:hypothetical protein
MAYPRAWRTADGRNPFMLDPTRPLRPQVLANILCLLVILGGPALGLVTIAWFPPLLGDNAIYLGGAFGIAVAFVASFALIRHADLAPGIPTWAELVFRAGWSLGVTFLLLGILGIANGYGTPFVTRDAPVVAKRQTLHRDPARRTYYVATRPWPGSRTVVELSAGRATYDRLAVPVTDMNTPQEVLDAMPDAGRVRLTVGEGRLGLEWLRGIGVAP